MRLLIVSGLSGSGKSIALDTLEDCGFNCIDNLPISMLEDFINKVMLVDKAAYEKTAIGIDARNQCESLVNFPASLQMIRSKGISCEVLFMQAEEATLLKRYSETRRRHPLTDQDLPLKEAIRMEHGMLSEVVINADLVIDTSRTHFHQLRDLIRSQVGEKQQEKQISLQLQSFGFKHGIPLDADFVFDARSLPNPYWEPSLRGLTGKDAPVAEFLKSETLVHTFMEDVSQFVGRWVPHFEEENRSYLTIAIGCTGGQHRSVFLIDSLGQYFREQQYLVIVRHRELM